MCTEDLCWKGHQKHRICLPCHVEIERTKTQRFSLKCDTLNYWPAQGAFCLHLTVVKFSIFQEINSVFPFPSSHWPEAVEMDHCRQSTRRQGAAKELPHEKQGDAIAPVWAYIHFIAGLYSSSSLSWTYKKHIWGFPGHSHIQLTNRFLKRNNLLGSLLYWDNFIHIASDSFIREDVITFNLPKRSYFSNFSGSGRWRNPKCQMQSHDYGYLETHAPKELEMHKYHFLTSPGLKWGCLNSTRDLQTFSRTWSLN